MSSNMDVSLHRTIAVLEQKLERKQSEYAQDIASKQKALDHKQHIIEGLQDKIVGFTFDKEATDDDIASHKPNQDKAPPIREAEQLQKIRDFETKTQKLTRDVQMLNTLNDKLQEQNVNFQDKNKRLRKVQDSNEKVLNVIRSALRDYDELGQELPKLGGIMEGDDQLDDLSSQMSTARNTFGSVLSYSRQSEPDLPPQLQRHSMRPLGGFGIEAKSGQPPQVEESREEQGFNILPPAILPRTTSTHGQVEEQIVDESKKNPDKLSNLHIASIARAADSDQTSERAPHKTYAQATETKPKGPDRIMTDKEIWAQMGLTGPPPSSPSPTTSESGNTLQPFRPEGTPGTAVSKPAVKEGLNSLDIPVTDPTTVSIRKTLVASTLKPADRKAPEGAAQAQHNWTQTGASRRSLNAPIRKGGPLPIFDAGMPEIKDDNPPASLFPGLEAALLTARDGFDPFREGIIDAPSDTDAPPSKRQRKM